MGTAFVGCGDDSSTSSDSKESSDSDLIVETFDDLVVCTEKRKSSVAYVKDEKTEYTCIDGKWTADDDEELSSSSVILSSSEDEESSSSIVSSSSVVSSSSKAVSSSSQESNVLKDSRDGKSYKTVTIGIQNWTQTWMAQNLNYTPDTTKYAGYRGRTWCYKNSLDSCAKYGRLYTWAAAMDSAVVFSINGLGCGKKVTCSAGGTIRGICPEGWHLPSSTEWSALLIAAGGTDSAGTALKSTSGWYNDGNGEESFGFSVLPAGGRYDVDFANAGKHACFWSSTEDGDYYANYWYFDYGDVGAGKSSNNKNYAFSVRCLKDSD